jgi:hypothetical protein
MADLPGGGCGRPTLGGGMADLPKGEGWQTYLGGRGG